MIDEEDGVVDRDPARHDQPEIGLSSECGSGAIKDQKDADERHGDRQQHTQWLPQRLEERRSHRVHEEDRNDEDHVDLVELLAAPAVRANSVDGVTGRNVGARDHGLVMPVAEPPWPQELVGDVPLILLVLAMDVGEHLACLDRRYVTHADTSTTGHGNDCLAESQDVAMIGALDLHQVRHFIAADLERARPATTPDDRVKST